MEKSAVIIGGGLGGLFTGAILSKEGVKVTVIEKNPTVGGGLQSFRRFGETFDTGMHVIGGMQEGGNIRRICEYLGIFDKVHVMDVDPDVIDTLYFAEDKKVYKIAQGKEGFVNALSESFPDQKDNLRAYVDAVYAIVDELDMFYLRPSQDFIFVHSEDFMMPADGFIAKYISDSKLCSVLAYMNPLYGGRANMTPAYIHALISVLYINGPSRFAGGSQLFADALRDKIAENGGEVVAGDAVVSISSEEKVITGVTTKKGRTFTADYYISAIHPCSLVKLFDDPQAFFDLERLLDAQETTFDLIDCNGDIAMNICSVGLDARIGTDVSRYKRLPLLQGFRAYAASTVVNVVKGIAEHYVVEVDGETIDGEFTFICVCNGRWYGGGFNPVPEADPTDGKLDVLLVKKVSRLQVAGLIGKYKNGRYKEIGHVARYLKTDHLKIRCAKPCAINLDGEIRFAKDVVMKVADEKIRFFYPKGLTWKHT